MTLIDVNISRTLTINTGNYESIKPSVSISIKDVEVDKVADTYLALDDVLTGILKLEIANCSNELEKTRDGLSQYRETIDSNIQQIGNGIERALKDIEEL